MNSTDQDHIPTLTDIIQPGDAAMKDHFDESLFGVDETPAADHESRVSEALKQTIELLIQEALNETLPSIEAQLKTQLTEKVLEKLDRDSKR